jgi:hypothetical protein
MATIKLGMKQGLQRGETRAAQRQDDFKDNPIVTLICAQVNQHLHLLVHSPSCMYEAFLLTILTQEILNLNSETLIF